MKADGFNPVGHEITGTTARLQIENLRYRSSSQAVGRAARIASRYFGDEITIFVIDLVEKNLPLTSVEISRESLVAYEFNLAPAKEFMDQVVFMDVKSLVSAPEEKYHFIGAFGPILIMVFLILTSQFALNLAWLWNRNTSFRPPVLLSLGSINR